MEQNANGIRRQLVLRMFLPNMETLKATARQVSAMPGVKLGLYGQAGEVLVAVNVTTATAAAATELAENAAARFEQALGDSVYGRGKDTLAHFVAEELEASDSALAAADAGTGSLLTDEMKTAKHGEHVFDFGEMSYANARISEKIEHTAQMGDEGKLSLYQQAADRSFSAEKCAKCDFGVAITGTEPGSSMVCVAVTHKKLVYVRCIRPAADAAKAAALSALDMIRRLSMGLPIAYARPFLASEEIDWNNPIALGKKGAKGVKKGGNVAVIVLTILVAIALVIGGVFIYTTFFSDAAGGNASSLPASETGASTSASTQAPASLPAGSVAAPAVASAPGSAAPVDAATSQVTHPLNG